jgi:hypothetical protein
MTDNDKLIEDSKSGLAAFDSYWGDGGPVDAAHGRPWELIRRLLAVFEKAHTPTDDQRTPPRAGSGPEATTADATPHRATAGGG